jgi:glycosyltransferase involved in cell wall biosynthesis
MSKLVILIPVLRRPQNVGLLVTSITKNSGGYELLFIASPNDKEEIDELENQKQQYVVMDGLYTNRGDYARKINRGFKEIEADWYFLGADDLRFHTGWFEEAMIIHAETNACVIGTNDMGNPAVIKGNHSTHSLVLRDYIKECGGSYNEPGRIYHEGYRHNFVDTELVATAKSREAWAFSSKSLVEHLHPDWKKGHKDDVYELGKSGWYDDQKLFEKRSGLWK